MKSTSGIRAVHFLDEPLHGWWSKGVGVQPPRFRGTRNAEPAAARRKGGPWVGQAFSWPCRPHASMRGKCSRAMARAPARVGPIHVMINVRDAVHDGRASTRWPRTATCARRAYGFFPPKGAAGLDLTLYLMFFIHGVVAFVWAATYAGESWASARVRTSPPTARRIPVQTSFPPRRRVNAGAGLWRSHCGLPAGRPVPSARG